MEEPVPTNITANITEVKVEAKANVMSPVKVKHAASVINQGFGFRSRYNPMRGCSTDADIW